MNEDVLKFQNYLDALIGEKEFKTVSLFSGIDLMYVKLTSDSFSIRYDMPEHIMLIHYCKAGQIVWNMKNGNCLYLNSKDHFLHTANIFADSTVTLPSGQYEGLIIFIDLRETAAHPPELLKETAIFKTLQKKFCQNDSVSFLAGNERAEEIFSDFYSSPKDVQLAYQKIKTLELLLYLYKSDFARQDQLSVYPSEQIEIIREIHDRLIQKIGERITIEELSKEYLINPTTLKTAFKAVYGTSIAAHIKEHRMKMAAEMLRESDQSIAETARAVGYDSQSKFSAAFKAYYKVLPKEYKKL